ncbi:unnamed protein product [Camellia sinensis]
MFIFLVIDVEVVAIFQTRVSRWLQTGSSKNSSISRSSNNLVLLLLAAVKLDNNGEHFNGGVIESVGLILDCCCRLLVF